MSPAAAPIAQSIPVSRPMASPWLVLGAVYLASIAAVMAQFAAPPLMPLLIESFGVDLAAASSMMSVFSITGLVLALPAGLLLVRYGARATIVAAMASVVLGSLLGVVAPDFGMFLAGRAVQGVGVGLVGVAAPAVVAGTFPDERRGLPMGIWATWVPVGGILMYLIGPALASTWGWAAAWWLSAAVAAVAGVVVFGVVRGGGPSAGAGQSAGAGSRVEARGTRRTSGALGDLRLGLSGREIWILAAVFGLSSTAAGGVNAFLATFLVDERGFELAMAAAVSSLVLVGAGVGSFGSGLISDKIGSRRLVFTIASVLMGVLVLLPFTVESMLPLVLFAVGLSMGAVPSALFAAVPEAMPLPRLAGAGMAALMLGQNAGMVLGPTLFAVIEPVAGWVGVGVAMGVVSVTAACVGWLSRVK